jgi:hypothetical protein
MQPDPDTLSLLDLIDSDPRREHDRARIDDVVRRVAMRDGGTVSTNAVRKELTGEWGLTVLPQAIGPRLAALTRQGVLEVVGWEENDGPNGNAGRPQKLRRWVGAA